MCFKILAFYVLVVGGGFFPALVFSATGTIDATFKYAWGEDLGWINFGTSATSGNVQVTDTGLTGYAWSENYGWINLNPASSGVQNNGSGGLSGSAWGEGVGYINFGEVTISATGTFTGIASGSASGRINFDCANCRVVTDWRQATTSSPAPIQLTGGGGGSVSSGAPPAPPSTPSSSPSFAASLFQPLASAVQRINGFLNSLLNLLRPSPPSPPTIAQIVIPKITPLSFYGKWNLLPVKEINRFVFAPLPQKIALFVKKFPGLETTFKKIGIARQSDLKKLAEVKLSLPGLTETETVGLTQAGLPLPKLRAARFGLPARIPLAELPASVKKDLPGEIVFARAGGKKIDINIGLSLNKKGEIEKRIRAVVGSALNLVVKVDGKAKRVRGYLVLRNKIGGGAGVGSGLPLKSSLASIIFSQPIFSKVAEVAKYLALEGGLISRSDNLIQGRNVENRFALLEFDYTDPDGDGIYTADIQIPRVDGEYEIITRIDYEDEKLASKEIRITTIIDPEGYVYEKNGGKETRIPGAVVSLYVLNPATKQYELWPAEEYLQENPQVTDVRGTYAFLVPEGYYYINVTAPGYFNNYRGKPFEVKQGNEIHFNIELASAYGWLKILDWKTLLLIFVGLLLLYNFYKDRLRGKVGEKN